VAASNSILAKFEKSHQKYFQSCTEHQNAQKSTKPKLGYDWPDRPKLEYKNRPSKFVFV
jgi:hypothetical protein